MIKIATAQDVRNLYGECNAIYLRNYEGDPTVPHAQLTRGFHSDGYLDSPLVLSNPECADALASELAVRIYVLDYRPDWVIGSAYSAITFSYKVAEKLRARHGYTKKDPADQSRMQWQEMAIPENARIFQVEELIVSFGTTLEVRRAVAEENPEPVDFYPTVATIIYRPPRLDAPRPLKVIALAEWEIKSWPPDQCPLCKQGSRALRPKNRAHWAELTAKR